MRLELDLDFEEGSSVKRAGRIAHLVLTYIFLAAVVAQPFLVGLWLFGAVGTSDLHTTVGFTLLIPGCPLLLVAALLGRLPKREMILTGAVILDTFVQVSLPEFREDVPAVAALHPLNFLLLVILLWALVQGDRRLIREGTGAEPQPDVSAG